MPVSDEMIVRAANAELNGALVRDLRGEVERLRAKLRQAVEIAKAYSESEQIRAIEGVCNPRPFGRVQDSMPSNGADVADKIAEDIEALLDAALAGNEESQ